MTQFKCAACELVFAKPYRRPPSCPTQDRCNLVAQGEPPLPQAQQATTGKKLSQPPPQELHAVLQGRTYPVRTGATLGRNGSFRPELFREDTNVSRQHVRLELRDGSWFLINISTSSPCEINGAPAATDRAIKLPGGKSNVTLGGTFRLELLVPEVQSETSSTPTAAGALDEFMQASREVE
jgi:hypothetical protein